MPAESRMLFAIEASGRSRYRRIITGLGGSGWLVTAGSVISGNGAIPLLDISDRRASLATSVKDPASTAVFSSSPSSMPTYNLASRFRSLSQSICPMARHDTPQKRTSPEEKSQIIWLRLSSISWREFSSNSWLQSQLRVPAFPTHRRSKDRTCRFPPLRVCTGGRRDGDCTCSWDKN